MEDLLGPELINAEGETIQTSSLKGKLVGLFFSDGTNPSRKDFTNKLVAAHKENKAHLDVVLISSDPSAEDQMKYMNAFKMKWPALPFNPEKRKKLAHQFGVAGVPTLVILDNEGNHLTNQGRPAIANDPRQAIQEWRKAACGLKNPSKP